MTQGKYMELSVAQRTDLWRRWKAGESLHTIGRAVDRPHTSIHCPLAHHGGIIPAVRRIALRLNLRPRRTLGFQTPASKLRASVAPTG
jgi:transposase, IS30 family